MDQGINRTRDRDGADALVMDHRFHSPFWVAGQLARGHSLHRILFHAELRRHALDGATLDLGSKSSAASYYEFLRKADGVRITFTDLNPAKDVVQLNVEERFPFADATFDCLLSFNLFEHVFHFERSPAEAYRVLKPGGRALICTPFLHEHHNDPDDFYRFTASALGRLWRESGFKPSSIVALGEGLLTMTATKLASLVLPRALYRVAAPILYLLATPLDRMIALRPRIDGMTMPQRFALAYFCVFTKEAP